MKVIETYKVIFGIKVTYVNPNRSIFSNLSGHPY